LEHLLKQSKIVSRWVSRCPNISYYLAKSNFYELRFDIKYTINVAEFEFPAYYNFFFAK
jgi:hypothetical protein